MATKKKTAKKPAGKSPADIDVKTKPGRRGGRVPTDEERKEKGQIRRTLRVSDLTDAKDFEKLEKKHGGTSGALRFLLGIWRSAESLAAS